VSIPGPDCPGCGSRGSRWLSRLGGSRPRHLFQCRGSDCLLTFAGDDPDPSPPPEARAPELATGEARLRSQAERALLRGLQECLPPPAVFLPDEARVSLPRAVASAGYTFGGSGALGAILVTDSLQRTRHPREQLEGLRMTLGARGNLLLHLARYEDIPRMTRSPLMRHLFRPEYVTYFSFYSLMNLLWRAGFLAREWFLDEESPCMTVLAVDRASVPAIPGPSENRGRPSASPIDAARDPPGPSALPASEA
jgi:hypothetical protein